MNRSHLAILGVFVALSLAFMAAQSDVFIFSSASQKAAAGDVATGLVAHYTFDAEGGADSTGLNPGTLLGGPSFVAGKVGAKALSLDGTDDEINIGPAQNLNFERTDPFSVSLWVKMPENQVKFSSAFIKRGVDHQYGGWQVGALEDPVGTHNFTFTIGEAAGGSSRAMQIRWKRPAVGLWHHVVVTFDGSSRATGMKAFVDGYEVTDIQRPYDTLTGGTAKNDGTGAIGRSYEAPYFFTGELDDLRVYNRVLSTDDISSLYQLSGSGPSSDSEKPTVRILEPQNSTLVSGSVNISAEAEDNVGVTQVRFKVEDTTIATDTSAPFGTVLNTLTFQLNTGEYLKNTLHAITAVALDAAGNESETAVSFVTVANTQTPGPDTVPPVLKNRTASSFTADTTTVALRVETNEPASCRYSTAANTTYDAMTLSFAGAGDTNHIASVTGLAQGTHAYYVRCKDTSSGANANTSDLKIEFTIRTPLSIDPEILIDNSSGSTLLELPGSALWNKRVTFLPGDKEEVKVNPPMFSWQYVLPPNNSAAVHPGDFWLQVDNNQDFTSPEVSVRTEFNMYAYLAPFTPGTYYWRVGYMSRGSNNVSKFGPTRSFIVKSSTPQWDRSMLTDDPNINKNHQGYMASKASHPHMMFTANTRGALREYLDEMESSYGTNDPDGATYEGDIGRSWKHLKGGANAVVGASWLSQEHPEQFMFVPQNFDFPKFRTALKDDRAANSVILGFLGIGASGVDAASEADLIDAFKRAMEMPDLYKKVQPEQYEQVWHPQYVISTSSTKFMLQRARGELGVGWLLNKYEMFTLNRNLLTTIYRDSISLTVPFIKITDRANDLRKVAFVWQLTRDPKYTNGTPQALVYLARDFDRAEKWQNDAVLTGDFVSYETLAYGYDWFYDVPGFTAEMKAEVKDVLEKYASWILYGSASTGQDGIYDAWDWTIPENTEGIERRGVSVWKQNPTGYTGDSRVTISSLLRTGTSHSYDNMQLAFRSLLPIYGDLSPQNKRTFDFLLTYNLVKGSPFNYGNGAIGQGKSQYAMGNVRGPLLGHVLLKTVFPDVEFEKNPYIAEGLDWFSRVWPTGMMEKHDPWGDSTDGALHPIAQKDIGRMGALFLNNETLFRNWYNDQQAGGGALDYYPVPDVALSLAFLKRNTARTEVQQPLSKVLVPDGWVMGCSHPTASADCFQKGVGFLFQGRPHGQFSHDGFGDLSYQLWAYGTNFTEGGGVYKTNAAGTNMGQYSIMVNGLGHAQTNYFPILPYLSRIFAYKFVPNQYTYAAVDATNAYPRTNFVASWGQDGSPTNWWPFHSGAPLKDLTKVHRHFLFVKNKYFIVFDDLASDEPYTFSSLFPILEDTLTYKPGTNKTQFSYTSNIEKYMGRKMNLPDVTVHVAQIYNPKLDNAAAPGIRLDDLNTQSTVFKNPFVSALDYSDLLNPIQRKTTLWFSNDTPTTNWNFLTVIYPQNPAAPGAPIITRINDYTVKVEANDGTGSVDIVSFDAQSAPEDTTILVDVSALTPLDVNDDITGKVYGCGLSCIPPDGETDTSAPGINSISSSPSSTSAVISWSLTESAVSRIQYGLTTAYGSYTASSSLQTRTLTGLTPNTVYHYRLIASDAAGNTVYSSDKTFTTGDPQNALTVATSGEGTGVVTSSDGNIACGGGSTLCQASYTAGTAVTLTGAKTGQSAFQSWGGACAGTATTSSCVVTLSGSVSVTATFVPVLGGGTSGNDLVISEVSANRSPSATTITWKTSAPATSRVEYGTDVEYGAITPDNAVLTTDHSVVLSGLTANVVYNYRVISRNSAGVVSTSENDTFSTDFTPPVITLVAPLSTLPAGTTVTPLSISVNESSSCRWGKDAKNLTGLFKIARGVHTAMVDVAPNTLATPKTYSFYVTCTDRAGNAMTSPRAVTMTLAAASPVVAPPVVISAGGTGPVTRGGGGSSSSSVTASSTTTSSSKTLTGNTTVPIQSTAACTTVTVPVVSPYKRVLKVGSVGDDVKSLQVFLNTRGYKVASSGSGSLGKESTYFGQATKAALSKFQSANGISPANGELTQATIEKVNTFLPKTTTKAVCNSPVSAPASAAVPRTSSVDTRATESLPSSTKYVFTRNLQVGSDGADVRALQVFLNTHGYPVASTGNGSLGKESTYFGPATKAALIKYQLANKISPASGILGPFTRSKINATN